MMDPILLDEIRTELERLEAEKGNNDGMRTIDLAYAFNVSVDTMRKRIASAIRAGIIEPVPLRMINMMGRKTTTVGYRLKKNAE